MSGSLSVCQRAACGSATCGGAGRKPDRAAVRRADAEPADQPGRYRTGTDAVGVGLSAFAGRAFVGLPIRPLQPLHIRLSELPIIGPLLFHYDALVYLSLLLCALLAWALKHTRVDCGCGQSANHRDGACPGRAGDAHSLFRGAVPGDERCAGAYLSTALTPCGPKA